MGCGTGRLAYGLIREGAKFTGIDNSAALLALANKKLKGIGTKPTLHISNMSNFNLYKKFDLIFIGFNSFLHLLTDNDALSCFKSVKKHMHQSTRFLIDIFIPNPLFLYKPDNMRIRVLEYIDSGSGKKIVVDEISSFNSKNDINNITWYFSHKEKKDFCIEKFSMKMYFPSKMNQLITDAGYTIVHQWGDYNRSPIGECSKLQIYDVRI